ncbi:MAG: T9SS type A sorting domain-containing protein, partial [Candidatus Marinimicrobia bacterium]|nr:T9SS type A sorting domain-containing protein [Candidatus Neomarinimicrobiota bacterium]
GIQQWVARYDGPGNASDVATALALDAAGNVYVTGISEGSGTSVDYATVKYNTAGIQQWVARYDGPGNSDDGAAALALDAAGNVYVTGPSVGVGTSDNYATVKYDTAGVQQWVARYEGPENSSDVAAALALDAAGNVYVTGSSQRGGSSVYTTIMYVQTPPVSVAPEPGGPPRSYRLAQNYPNPFNPVTTLRFDLPQAGQMTLVIYDLLGQEVRRWDILFQSAGYHQVIWDASSVASGVYLYRLEAGDFVQTRKMLLLR